MQLLRAIAIVGVAIVANEALRRNGIDLLARVRHRLGRSGTDTPAPAPARRIRHGAVDHTRQPGVPPEHNLDYQDLLDIELAGSFPASDPPSGW